MPVSYGNMIGMVVYVRKETYEKLKKLAELEQRSMTGMVRAILESFFEMMEQEGVRFDGTEDGQTQGEARTDAGEQRD